MRSRSLVSLRPLLFLGVVVTAFAIGAAACGGETDGSDHPTPAPTATTTPTVAPTGDPDAAPPGDAGPAPTAVPLPLPSPPEDECTYDYVQGTMTVVSIAAPGPDDYACALDGKVVTVEFAPTDPSQVPADFASGAPWTRTLTIEDGIAPPSECLAPLGIVAGANLPAQMGFEKTGSCDPTYLMPAVSLALCQSLCNGGGDL